MKRKLNTLLLSGVLALSTVALLASCGAGSNTETVKPTETPTVNPTEKPTETPTETPTEAPTVDPTEKPTETPVVYPEHISMIGAFGGHNWDYDLDLVSKDEGKTWATSADVELHAGEQWKLRQNHAWNGQTNGADWSYKAITVGAELAKEENNNITTLADGLYKVEFNYTEEAISLTKTGEIEAPQEDKKVTFNVQNEAGEWQVLNEEVIKDGKVTLPEAPKKDYYNFIGWFLDKDLKNEFTNTNLEESVNVYAGYVAAEVTIHINDDEPVVKKLIDVVNSTYNPGEGLNFDGWYKDADCKVKWNGKDDVKDLYAKSVALLTFNNGYEDVYVATVKPGTVFKAPGEQMVEVEGQQLTLEAKEIVKPYMSEKNIHYVDAEGNPFDFTKAIEKNTTVTVNWNTKGLEKYVAHNEVSDTYFIQTYSAGDVAEAPVWSMQSEFTISETQGDTTVEKVVNVEGFSAYGDTWLPTKAEKLIFGEGIKFVKGMNANSANVIKEISLPKSMRVIDNCFNGMTALEGVTLNEGLEVVIGSFFKTTLMADYASTSYGTSFDTFEINVPASVKNLSMVPSNLTFAEGSNFYNKDGRIFLKKGEQTVLVSDPVSIGQSTIVVPEVDGIQVGTYCYAFDYLKLPATFSFVNYNEDIANYPYYSYIGGSIYSQSDVNLYDPANFGEAPQEFMAPNAYSISASLGGYYGQIANQGSGTVIFSTETRLESINKFAFAGDASGYAAYTGGYSNMEDPALKNYVVFKDTTDNVYVSLRIDRAEEEKAGYLTYSSYTAILEAGTLTMDDLMNAIKTENPDQVEAIDAAIAGKTLVLLQDNKEVSIDSITGEAYLSIEIR